MFPILAGLKFLPFLKTYGKAIIAAALIAAAVIYVGVAERNRALVKQYEAEDATQLTVIAHQDEQIRALNQRIEANNARWLEQVQRETERLNVAKREAAQIRAERDRITAALSESRREWQEAIAHDEALADFVAHPVPDAVWRRMRSAAGH